MSAQPAVPILRVFIQPGHGFSNHTPGVFDDGAVSSYGVEATLAASVADGVVAAIDADDSLDLMVQLTPQCDEDCLHKHPSHSHLAYIVDWVNSHSAPFDVLLSIHLNDSDDASATGVEVYYSQNTPQHKAEALKLSQIIATYLGLRSRGAFPSNQSQHTHLGILDDTKPKAYLIELGFVSNGKDVAAIKQCGVGAVLEAIKALRGAK